MNSYMCACFPFGFDGGMWDMIVLISDHCLSVNSTTTAKTLIRLGECPG